MRRFPHIVVVYVAALTAACFPYLSGKVICSAAEGHFAVEPQHASGGCAGSIPHHDNDGDNGGNGNGRGKKKDNGKGGDD